MSTTLDLINAIESGKTRETESVFNEIVTAKMEDAIEYRRMEISQSMFATPATDTE
jgi:hypothetical protein